MKLFDYAMGLTLGFLLSAGQEGVRAAPSPTPNPQDTSNSQTSYSSSIPSSSLSGMPTHPLGGQSIVYGMAVTPSDLAISYVPELAWITRSSQQDSASCLAGTKSSSTPGSYLEYKFTGSGIQLYTAASATAGSFTVSLDGSPYGSFSISKDESSGQGEGCAARLLVDINSLPNVPHTLKVTVTEGPTGPDGLNFVFAGFGLSSVSSNGSLLRNTTAADDTVSSTHKNNVGAIVGAALGSMAAVLFIALGLFFFLKRQQRAAAAKAAIHPPVGSSKVVEDDQKTLYSADSHNDLKAKV